MFGTLVIQLPSHYNGGKLIVYHQGKKSEFDYSGLDSCSNCYFTSFYADCQHEIKEVTKGFRLCLVYNLMYQGLDECPTPANNQEQVSAIVSAMKKWEEDIKSEDCPSMMTYLLEHKYCEASLSFKFLKNVDQAIADVLVQAKAEVDFDLYMGNVSFSEVWSADGYSRYGDLDELIDEHIFARHLKLSDTATDGKESVADIELHKTSFVPEDFFDTIDPDQEELEEAMGNGGATLDKRYNWAALLLWPLRKRISVKGVQNMVTLFKQDVDAGKKDLENDARDLIRELHNEDSIMSREQTYLTFLHALEVLANAELITKMLNGIATIRSSYGIGTIIENPTFFSLLISIAHKHGWDLIKSPLLIMFGRCSSNTVEKYCTFLERMIASKQPDDEKDLYKNLLSNIVKGLAEEEDRSSSRHYIMYQPPKSKEFVCQLFSLLTEVGSDDLFTLAVSALRNQPARYPILQTIGPAIVDFYKSVKIEKNGPLQELLTYCISQLEVSVQKVPESNAKPVKFSCSCKDCIELKDFLRHPTQVQRQFRIGKDKGRHLRQQLDKSSVNVTDRYGSPRTLMVTKKNISYQKDSWKQKQEQALLTSLQPLLAVTGASSQNEPPNKKQKSNIKVASGSSYIDLT